MNLGERGKAYIASRFGLVDRAFQRHGTVLVVAGLTLGPAETGHLVGLGLEEAAFVRRSRGATDVDDGVVEPMLDAGELAKDRVAADMKPRIVDRGQPPLDLVARVYGACFVAG